MQTLTNLTNRPAWVDLATPDAAASRDFYGKLFGWQIQIEPDPQYGGYGMAEKDGTGIAGIGPKQDPNSPTVWSLYFGSDDLSAPFDCEPPACNDAGIVSIERRTDEV